MDRPPRKTLPRSARVRTRADFDRIFGWGVRASDGLVTLLAAPRDGSGVRLGISISRRYGNAVQRNRMKRLIREAFRTMRPDLPPGTDWIVIPRPGSQADLSRLHRSIRLLSERLSPRLQSRRPR